MDTQQAWLAPGLHLRRVAPQATQLGHMTTEAQQLWAYRACTAVAPYIGGLGHDFACRWVGVCGCRGMRRRCTARQLMSYA